MSVIIYTPDDARRQVDQLVEAGVDPIKLYARLEWVRALAGMQVCTAGLIESGARIVAGSDTPFVNLAPGSSLHDELQYLVDCGMRPAQAVDAETRSAAAALGLGALAGTIEPGKDADLLLISGDPGQDIRALSRIEHVVRDGRRCAPSQILAEAETLIAAVDENEQRRISDTN